MRTLMRLAACAMVGISCARSVRPMGETYEILMARADTLTARCQWTDATALLWRAAAAAPDEIAPWLRIGDCLNRAGEAQEALTHWERILAVRPGEHEARVGRWVALVALAGQRGDDGLRSVVRQEADSLAAVLPRTKENLELAVQGYQTIGEDSLAHAVGSILALRFPGSRIACDVVMASYYDSLYPVWNDTPGKIAFLRRYVRDNPESVMRPEAYATLAGALASSRRVNELAALLRAWLDESPDDLRALATASHWYLENDMGDYRALQYGRRAVDAVLCDTCPAGYPLPRWEMESCAARILAEVSYARALLRRGDIETAWRMATETTERPVDRWGCEATVAPAYYVLAQCELAMGRLPEAGCALVQALEAGDVKNLWASRAESLLTVVMNRMHRLEAPREYARAVRSYEGPVFSDVTVPAGLAGVRGGRVAWGDVNADGFEDLLVGGTRLFLNGGGTFEEATAAWGLSHVAGSGGLLADMNNDGLIDLVVGGSGGISADRLFLSDGTTFRETAFPSDSLPTEGVGVGDFDGDGFLDVYLAKYERPGSMGQGVTDRLLMNRRGDFVDETAARGVTAVPAAAGRGVSCADYDGDGDLDIFVSNYRLQPNRLWTNDGAGFFTEDACVRGVRGVDHDGWFGHTIGSDWGDYDNDGDLDLISANLAHPRYIHFSDKTMVLRNDAERGRFIDVAEEVGIPYEETSSDPCWADFDNDGDLDLYLTSVYENRRSYLLLSEGGHFRDVTYLAGVRTFDSWGCAVSDFDNDGDLDLAVGGAGGVRLFRNDTGGRAIRVACVGNGTTTNTSCIGCRVVVRDGRRAHVREVQGGKGTTSQNSLVQHVGLPEGSRHVDVEVRFTDGEVRVIPGIAAGLTLHVFE